MSERGSLLSVFALGGINEIGKNMYVIEYGDDLVIIDCGAKFADQSLLGIDLIIPDISYLHENKHKIRGLVVTHGHEDHIGGIPYFLKKLNVPVYATRFTLGLIELKLKEHKILRESTLIEINSNSTLDFGNIQVSFFRTSHSIPDCLGILFDTPEGKIVHTGDFKFDLTPVNDQYSDIHKMAKIGEDGILLLISESTNAERPGSTPSEKEVGKHIEEAFYSATGKVIISTFASNVNRVQQIVEACKKTNRKLALLGRSMVNVVSVARQRGYLDIPDWMLVDARDVRQLPPERVVVLCTGSQGEPLAALSRLSTNSNRDVKVLQNDTVIFAASPIPGNEKDVSKIVDNLFQLGANVIYGSSTITGMHVSGHGYQEDLKWMISLMKPKYFIPIHGEYRMLHLHKKLAEAVGVEKGHTFIIRNGDVVDVQHGEARQTRKVTAGDTYVDNAGADEVGDIVLRDRKQLSEEGMLVIVVSISKENGNRISDPDSISRGFVYAKNSEELLTNINEVVKRTIDPFKDANIMGMKRAIKKEVGTFVFEQTNKKPMILPIIIAI
ncbi:ribonuclease J [Ureibacillus massiliensis 4400831 = CIP 108448 = CCUG 49529]|uniref:Ribonuclease J n=2 Tax=Ureibacillus massiliensis TaxID=292806 RepID=A0A0A3J5G2_9BACL|nr:ribonuclease J [Ureibacillus massiliensis]KGR90970.1 ribonuclease J [Ureibacillus massiliensis 4400831 = CIP 108448 = CCUG 49529]